MANEMTFSDKIQELTMRTGGRIVEKTENDLGTLARSVEKYENAGLPEGGPHGHMMNVLAQAQITIDILKKRYGIYDEDFQKMIEVKVDSYLEIDPKVKD